MRSIDLCVMQIAPMNDHACNQRIVWEFLSKCDRQIFKFVALLTQTGHGQIPVVRFDPTARTYCLTTVGRNAGHKASCVAGRNSGIHVFLTGTGSKQSLPVFVRDRISVAIRDEQRCQLQQAAVSVIFNTSDRDRMQRCGFTISTATDEQEHQTEDRREARNRTISHQKMQSALARQNPAAGKDESGVA